MKYTKIKTLLMLSLIAAVSPIIGCKFVDEPIVLTPQPAVRQAPAPYYTSPETNPAIADRFKKLDDNNVDAVKSALTWSKRYDDLAVKTEGLREKNKNLIIENLDYKDKLTKLQAKLDQTTSELDDANKFLQDLQLELTKWKADVIGFRDEIRAAQTAQLQALAKIMKVLGAESTVPQLQNGTN